MRKFLDFSRFVVLAAITMVALFAMVVVSLKTSRAPEAAPAQPLSAENAPTMPVAVKKIEREKVEITDTRSGLIEPFERFSLAFEISGRVKSLGKNLLGSGFEQDEDLDEGDRVSAGQVLAQLDTRALEARRDEARTRHVLAQGEYQRALDLKNKNRNAISDRDFDIRRNDLEVAKAQLALAEKSLSDATLLAPADGVISLRYANPGESVNVHQPIFEMVQVDRVLLVVGVPESRIPDLAQRMREVQANRKQRGTRPMDYREDLEFKAYVNLVSVDQYQKERPPMVGSVYRISETADETTGLFEVEILLDNRDGLLKPGLVARAQMVFARIDGYGLPKASVVFRGNQAFLFVVMPETAEVDALTFNVGDRQVYRAKRIALSQWIEQGPEVIVDQLPAGAVAAVVRGQHRLVDGQFVKLVASPGQQPEDWHPEVPVNVPAVSARP